MSDRSPIKQTLSLLYLHGQPLPFGWKNTRNPLFNHKCSLRLVKAPDIIPLTSLKLKISVVFGNDVTVIKTVSSVQFNFVSFVREV